MFFYLFAFLELIFKLAQSNFNFDLFFLFPKVCRDEFLKILIDFFNHDQPFKDSFGLLLHEANNEVELVEDGIQFPTS